MIGHQKFILQAEINDIDALVSFEMFFSHQFLESKFVSQLGQR